MRKMTFGMWIALAGLAAGCGGGSRFPVEKWQACQKALERGLRAEVNEEYETALGEYRWAAELDPSDPIPRRFLGEVYRHHTGEWEKAEEQFNKILELTADGSDPLSRAVALHGLGKISLWKDRFPQGLALMEKSLTIHPIPLTCRNLAVYWHSEGEFEKAWGYVNRALELAPDDPYNRVFHAAFLAFHGKPGEAKEILAKVPFHPEQYYNRACIALALGDREKAIELLRKHFYEYEQYDRVRKLEMKEARSDIFFRSILRDPAFLELTSLADAPGMPPAVPPYGMRSGQTVQ